MTARLELRDITVQYRILSPRDHNLKRQFANWIRRAPDRVRTVTALDGVSITITDGQRIGLIGANGAGKTTLLQVLAGVLPPTDGRVSITGQTLALLGGAGAGLDPEASGRDNIISLGLQLGIMPRHMRGLMDDIIDFSGLGERIDDPVFSYSTGMSARIRFATLTALRPDVLILDEGIGTADAAFNARANERLEGFLSGAGILVLASHSAEMIEASCTEAVWLDRGRVIGVGPVTQILQRYRASWNESSSTTG